jgi:hypothetical protein
MPMRSKYGSRVDQLRNSLVLGLVDRIEYMRQNKDLFYDLSNLFWESDTQMESRLAEYVKRYI